MGCAREVVAQPAIVYAIVSLLVTFGFDRLRRLRKLSTGFVPAAFVLAPERNNGLQARIPR